MSSKASNLQITNSELLRSYEPKKSRARASHKDFAIVSLDDGWGYRVMTAAGRGAAIALYAIFVQRTKGTKEVPITAAVLDRCGVTRKMRTLTINRLVRSGLATVRYRGKFRGCPLLTLLPPGPA